MIIRDWNIEAMTGYTPKTTFYTDFSIADNFGAEAIKGTYYRAFTHWKKNVEYVTELVMALNWKIWEHYHSGNEKIARLYDQLWREASEWCCENLEGEDLEYYFRTID